jgi:hypothetical protein
MKVSTNQKIVDYLNFHEGYVSGLELEMQATKWFTKPSTISRRARELVDRGTIERKLSGRFVSYRKPQPVIAPEIEEIEDKQEILF